MPETTRRTFIGAGAAFVAALRALPAADARKAALTWELPDGTARDHVMVRRLFLDLAGRIPLADEAREYAASSDPRRREKLVEKLLASEDFADFQTMRFADLMSVKSEFPINLWPNAVYAYHRRIRRFVASGESWDRFGRALLLSEGSDFRDGEVNFMRALVDRSPAGLAKATARVFLGFAPDEIPPERLERMAAAFRNVRFKSTREWKEEIVYSEGPDLRRGLCDELFGAGRRETARAFERLIRLWTLGPDFAEPEGDGTFDLRAAFRRTVLSDLYSRGSVTGGFPVRRIEAETLDDALCSLSGDTRDYQSPAPEPFTFLPPGRRTAAIEDGSISSAFLTLFGRPSRDTGLPAERGRDTTAKQRLHLYNSVTLHRRLGTIANPSLGRGPDGKNLYAPIVKRPIEERLEDLWMRVLSRPPDAEELGVALGEWKRRRAADRKASAWEFMRDAAWCLVNGAEFLFRG